MSSSASPPGAAAGAGASAAKSEDVPIFIGLPKGHMQENIFALLEEAGLKVCLSSARGYRPTLPPDAGAYDVKLLKPQNILGMLHAGTRDCGFAGGDWAQELSADVVQVRGCARDGGACGGFGRGRRARARAELPRAARAHARCAAPRASPAGARHGLGPRAHRGGLQHQLA